MARQQQFKILFAVIALGILAGAAVGTTYYLERVVKPERAAMKQMKEQRENPDTPAPDPGKKEFAAAVELIRAGRLEEAQERLAYLMRYYPESSSYGEARRIAGEINLDQLLSDTPSALKVHYTVRSGDALTKIASQYQSTLDYIMRANGRTGTVIHVGDKLWVAPLVFLLEAQIEKKRLTVYRLLPGASVEEGPEEVFFKDYAILDVNLPPTVRVPSSEQINDKPAWLGTKRAQFAGADYHVAHRWLQTKRPGLVLQAMPEDIADAPFDKKTGILLDPGDMKELYVYIRTGTELRLSND